MKRLKELRKQHHLTQAALANYLGNGITQRTISKYELGTNEPDFATLKDIASFFDTSTDFLVEFTDNPHSLILKYDNDKIISSELFSLMNRYNLLSASGKKICSDYIDFYLKKEMIDNEEESKKGMAAAKII